MTAHPVIAAPPPTAQVTIPLRVVNESNGSHGHWSAKARRRAQARSLVHLALPGHLRAAGLAMGPPSATGAVELAVTLTRIAPSDGLDDDNLRVALKAVRDQVAEELGLPSDRDPRVRWEYGQQRGKRGDLTLARGYGVRIEIRSAA